ncbi:MAG: nuclear transport factor 2 family protein [Chloroflexi bacterium]|nr:nuclear transport factor 2 family protein [Chloroflexota bacterium]
MAEAAAHSDLTTFILEYTDAVYHARNPEAAARYIADPCIRHEHGHAERLSLTANQRRIAEFLAGAANVHFENVITVAQGELFTTCYDMTFDAGGEHHEMSGVEVFRIQGGKITETWNAAAGQGLWG